MCLCHSSCTWCLDLDQKAHLASREAVEGEQNLCLLGDVAITARDSDSDPADQLLAPLPGERFPASYRHPASPCGEVPFAARAADSACICRLLLSENALAARENLRANSLKGDIRQGNILSSVEETLDTVICNPPFHDGHKQLTSIAESMFHESFHQLRSGGELLVVANRHLPYTKVLKRLFRNVELISDDKRFNIYRCVR